MCAAARSGSSRSGSRTHVEAGYGTAQGRYLGKVTAGGRDGNHLTDCLLTRDPDVYGPTRPAQLWRSALWRDGAWDTADCPPFDDVPPLGPLTAEAVASWAASPTRTGRRCWPGW